MNKEVRLLNEKGTEVFAEYLSNLRVGLREPPPCEILDDVDYTRPLVGTPALVESRTFASRMEAAAYLADALKDVGKTRLEQPDLWGWLSLFYFDTLCPPRADGTRKPGKDYRYILSRDYRYYYRHLLAGPVRLYQALQHRARLLLANPVDKPGDINEQLASRQDIISNRGVMEAVDLLYYVEAEESPKRGVAGKRPGNLRRFVTVVQQLDLTYDLYSMNGSEILQLLPAEFDRWHD